MAVSRFDQWRFAVWVVDARASWVWHYARGVVLWAVCEGLSDRCHGAVWMVRETCLVCWSV